MKKKLSYGLITALVFIVIGITLGITLGVKSAKDNGYITVEVKNLDDSILVSEEIAFKRGDQLMDLIQENFDNVTYNDGMIMSIDSYVTPADWSTFLWIYVDGKSSDVGLGQIEFTDGTVITLAITAYVAS